MRLTFSSATITAIIFAARAKAAIAEDNHVASESKIAGDVVVVQTPPTAGSECVPAAESPVSDALAPEKTRPDVGALARCHPFRQVCLPDESSSLGGRCRNKIDDRATRRRRMSLLLRDEYSFVCPDTCPGELCSCANSTYYGFPDAQDCAPEVNAVCTAGNHYDCFNNTYIPFYEDVYCGFASCWLDGNSYGDCVCGYYENYCALYGSYYADAYPKVAEKCAVSDCCAGAATSGERVACIPEGHDQLAYSSKPSRSPSPSVETIEQTAAPVRLPTNTTMPTGSPVEDSNVETIEPTAVPVRVPNNTTLTTGSPVEDSNVETTEPTAAPVVPTKTTLTTGSPVEDSNDMPPAAAPGGAPPEDSDSPAPPPPANGDDVASLANGDGVASLRIASSVLVIFLAGAGGAFWLFA